MKNFFGRVLILITSTIHCVLFFVIVGIFLFFAFDDFNNLTNFFSGTLATTTYGGVALAILDFISFCFITILCMIDIIHAKSMKHAFFGSVVFFIINLITLLFNIFIPRSDNIYFDLFISISITLGVTSILLTIGSAFNFRKDCRY